MHLSEGYYEIIGSVKEDKSVRALTSIELGPTLGKFPLFALYILLLSVVISQISPRGLIHFIASMSRFTPIEMSNASRLTV